MAALVRGRLPDRQAFRLCRDPDCVTVYHGAAGARFESSDLTVMPGFKASGGEGLLCYCFRYDRAAIELQLAKTGETDVPVRITRAIRAGSCACEVRNPTGRCCLGDIERAVAAIRDRIAQEGS